MVDLVEMIKVMEVVEGGEVEVVEVMMVVGGSGGDGGRHVDRDSDGGSSGGGDSEDGGGDGPTVNCNDHSLYQNSNLHTNSSYYNHFLIEFLSVHEYPINRDVSINEYFYYSTSRAIV